MSSSVTWFVLRWTDVLQNWGRPAEKKKQAKPWALTLNQIAKFWHALVSMRSTFKLLLHSRSWFLGNKKERLIFWSLEISLHISNTFISRIFVMLLWGPLYMIPPKKLKWSVWWMEIIEPVQVYLPRRWRPWGHEHQRFRQEWDFCYIPILWFYSNIGQ